ncbi:DUF3618 domain-containing protein [Streptomyces sp. NPDC056479]|uniref:DUF3618 domain-containing protein n=1 Tax=Streptomyces sp. NPDC056479 TaxID=3345832 RepID=UPI00368EBDE7
MTDRAAGDIRGAAAKATGGAKGPTELRDQIERTRGELGDTVAELMNKADVKGRAMARAADLRDKAGAMTVQLRSSAAQAGHVVQDRATRAGHVVQDRATQAGHTVHDKATHAGHSVEHGVPRPVRTVVQAGLRHPRPVLVVGAAVGALIAAGMVRRRHEGHR